MQQPSQQQKQRAVQNSESVMRAYGVPKSSLGMGGGLSSLLDSGGSKALDGGGSKYSTGAGVGAGAGAGAGMGAVMGGNMNMGGGTGPSAYGAYPVSKLILFFLHCNRAETCFLA